MPQGFWVTDNFADWKKEVGIFRRPPQRNKEIKMNIFLTLILAIICLGWLMWIYEKTA